MMICVTNRKLCRGDFLERIEQLAAGGADAILLREKDLSVPEYAALAKQCLAICQAYHTPLWLNSFREVAGALQLPVQLPMPILRTLTESQRTQIPAIGASVHSPEEAVLAEKLGASWLIAGHIFATACKPDLPPRGLDFLRNVCSSVSIPVYAIGGITPERLPAITQAGAAGCCVMSQMMQCPDVPAEFQNWRKRI